MEDDKIPDSAITASSEYGSYRADQGRLHNQGGSRGSGSWLAGTNNNNQWFQVGLGDWTKVTRVCTQGRLNGGNWVTKYKLAYSYDGVFYKEYKEEGDDAKVRVYYIQLKVSISYLGRLGPKGVPFSSFSYIEGVGISQVEVYERIHEHNMS